VAQRNGALSPTVRAIIPYRCHNNRGKHNFVHSLVHMYKMWPATKLSGFTFTYLHRTSAPFIHCLPSTYVSLLSALVNHSVHLPSISVWAPAFPLSCDLTLKITLPTPCFVHSDYKSQQPCSFNIRYQIGGFIKFLQLWFALILHKPCSLIGSDTYPRI
jgi:hypothetical protein